MKKKECDRCGCVPNKSGNEVLKITYEDLNKIGWTMGEREILCPRCAANERVQNGMKPTSTQLQFA